MVRSGQYLFSEFFETVCGSTIESSSGEFGHINVESAYEDVLVDCGWQIIHSDSENVELKIHTIQIARSEECARSFLSVCIDTFSEIIINSGYYMTGHLL